MVEEKLLLPARTAPAAEGRALRALQKMQRHLPSGMIRLDPYQEAAKSHLLSHSRTVLADEAGLGKTYPAVMAAVEAGGRKLVVCPAYLISMWKEKVLECDPGASVETASGSRSGKEAALSKSLSGDGCWMMMSYHMFSRWFQSDGRARGSRWQSIIFDEAHYLRGRKSKWSKAAEKLNAGNIWMLTGTMLYKDPSDAFQILRVLDPDNHGSYWNWAYRWLKFKQTYFGPEVLGTQDPEGFRKMLGRYVFRRTFKDVGMKLPPLYHEKLSVDPSKDHAERMAQLTSKWRMQHPVLGRVTIASAGELVRALREETSSDPAKLSLLSDLISDKKGELCVVFTWYRDSLDRVAHALRGRGVFLVHGGMPLDARDASVQSWRESGDGVLAATVLSLKEGHDLQDANVGVFYEESYVGSECMQARARLHRRGQKRPVSFYCTHLKGTVDERVHRRASSRSVMNARAMLELAGISWRDASNL